MKIVIMHENVVVHDAVNNDIERMYRLLLREHEVKVFAKLSKNSFLEFIDESELRLLLNDPKTVVIYHVSTYWEEGYRLLRSAKAKIIFRYHNITPASYFKGVDPEAYKNCKNGIRQLVDYQKDFPKAYWICASAFNAKDLCYVDPIRVGVCPPFNNIEDWGSKKADEEVKKELEGFSGFNMLFVGRVVPNKGYVMLLNVLRQLKQSYPDFFFKMRIIGKLGVLPEYAVLLRGIIKKSGLSDNIEFIGEINDEQLIAYYKYSDLFLCLSQHEGFCVPIVEAQYFSIPIAALRYAAVPETIGEEQLLLPPETRDFASAVYTLAQNRDYREYLGKKGRENFDKRFSAGVINNCFIDEFNRGLVTGKDDTEEKRPENMLPIAFVMPWYGEKIPGGAEMEARGYINDLHASGVEVEMLTTCVKEFTSDWNEDYYPEGVEIINGVSIRRFKVKKRNPDMFCEVNDRLMEGKTLTEKEEEVFCRENVNSPELYDFIEDNIDKYRFFVFIPYMFGTTYYGMQRCLKKAVMIPCLHDESYAYMKCFKNLYERIAGIIYNAYPEQELANRLYDLSDVSGQVIGLGVDIDISYNAERFRKKYKINEPFLLYAGRKAKEKGVDKLIEYFVDFRENNDSDLKLVMIGSGEISVPNKYDKDIIDLGFVSRQDKYDACAAALCMCQMSKNESFSIVIMESWLCERPVIVNSACAVTSDFSKRFDGGFSVGGSEEFASAVKRYIDDPAEAKEMALNGKKNVHKNFARKVIVQNFLDFLDKLDKK